MRPVKPGCSTDIREQAAQHTLGSQSAGRRARTGYCRFGARAARQMMSNPAAGGATVFVLPRRARAHRNRRLRACARRQGQALCRSGMERERCLPRACAVLPGLGRRAQPLRGRGEDGQARCRARALRRFALRRRDVADQLARRQSRGAEEASRHRRRKPRARPGKFCRRLVAQWRPAGTGRHAETSPSARTSRRRRARSSIATR